jgi:hypothetical protein
MFQINNPMSILKVLDKSNCGKCNENTCLAFAAAVARGQKSINECPGIPDDIKSRFTNQQVKQNQPERTEDMLDRLKSEFTNISLEIVADKLGGIYKDGQLSLKVCGKNVNIDSEGNFHSDIHLHSWLTLPVLDYIVQGKGQYPSGKWLSFREFKNGQNWHNFFVQRCEKPIKKIADNYTDLFEDMLHIFNGKKVDNYHNSDISLVLYPLPKLPVLFCYWKPEDGLESDFHIYFDSTADNNLSMDGLYVITAGLAVMFDKICLTHN